MTTDKHPEKTIEELVAEFNVLRSHADELRRQMKELTRQIEARGAETPAFRGSSHEIDIPKLPPTK